jgi:uncharacterized protein YciI
MHTIEQNMIENLAIKNLFVVILRYIVPLDQIDACRERHIAFLENHYDETFIVSGRQVPANGGIIMAKSPNRQTLEKILNCDPFYVEGLAEYQIYEFTPTRYSADFRDLLK